MALVHAKRVLEASLLLASSVVALLSFPWPRRGVLSIERAILGKGFSAARTGIGISALSHLRPRKKKRGGGGLRGTINRQPLTGFPGFAFFARLPYWLIAESHDDRLFHP
jgi:hypothetical protein